MRDLTIAQKVYLAVLLTVGGAWLGLALGVPIYEYNYGKSALTALLEQLASILKFAVFGILAMAWVLQGVGVLPTVQPRPGVPSAAMSRLRNLAIWVVIALLLVFLFNLFQGNGGNKNPHPAPAEAPDLMTLLINWFPMLIIFGVWLFFFRRMRAPRGDNSDKPRDS